MAVLAKCAQLECARCCYRWELDAPPRLNWHRMRTNKNKELERLSQLYMKQIETAGIHFVEGRGKLLDAHTVEVNGKKFTVCTCMHSLTCVFHAISCWH